MTAGAPGSDRLALSVTLGLAAGALLRLWYAAWYAPPGSYAAMPMSIIPAAVAILLLVVTALIGLIWVLDGPRRRSGYGMFVADASGLVGWFSLSVLNP